MFRAASQVSKNYFLGTTYVAYSLSCRYIFVIYLPTSRWILSAVATMRRGCVNGNCLQINALMNARPTYIFRGLDKKKTQLIMTDRADSGRDTALCFCMEPRRSLLLCGEISVGQTDFATTDAHPLPAERRYAHYALDTCAPNVPGCCQTEAWDAIRNRQEVFCLL